MFFITNLSQNAKKLTLRINSFYKSVNLFLNSKLEGNQLYLFFSNFGGIGDPDNYQQDKKLIRVKNRSVRFELKLGWRQDSTTQKWEGEGLALRFVFHFVATLTYCYVEAYYQ